MQTKDWITVVISSIALAVSLYTIVERRLTVRRTERVRLSEIVADLNDVQIEEEKADRNQLGRVLVQAFNTRREILSQQALDLLETFSGRITAPEYRTLAHSLRLSGYWEDADRLWQLALSTARREGTTQTVFCLRGYGLFLFDLNKAEEGRALLGEASTLLQDSNDPPTALRQVETLTWWAIEEGKLAGGSAHIQRLLDSAELVTRDAPEALRADLRAMIDSVESAQTH